MVRAASVTMMVVSEYISCDQDYTIVQFPTWGPQMYYGQWEGVHRMTIGDPGLKKVGNPCHSR